MAAVIVQKDKRNNASEIHDEYYLTFSLMKVTFILCNLYIKLKIITDVYNVSS